MTESTAISLSESLFKSEPFSGDLEVTQAMNRMSVIDAKKQKNSHKTLTFPTYIQTVVNVQTLNNITGETVEENNNRASTSPYLQKPSKSLYPGTPFNNKMTSMSTPAFVH